MRRLVPHFILERHQLGQFSGSLEAAGLYIDLSGFSTMADILAGYDQPGAEALAEVMNAALTACQPDQPDYAEPAGEGD